VTYIPLHPDIPVTTAPHWASSGVTVAAFAEQLGFEAICPADSEFTIACATAGCRRLFRRDNGRIQSADFTPGSFSIRPAGQGSSLYGDMPARLSINIASDVVRGAWTQIIGTDDRFAEIRPIFGERDLLIGHVADIIANELGQVPHPAQRLLIDGAAAMLAAHVVRRYGTMVRRDQPGPKGLSRHSLSRVLFFMEENLDERITLDALSNVAHVSRFHFLRLFKASTGVTPMVYLEKSRIRRAQDLIQTGDLAMAAIAVAVGFSGHSHFCRRFRLHVGVAPTVYAREMSPKFKRTLVLSPPQIERI
jgi:AraC family transcriptional regulator